MTITQDQMDRAQISYDHELPEEFEETDDAEDDDDYDFDVFEEY